jgi:hypothetical protein
MLLMQAIPMVFRVTSWFQDFVAFGSMEFKTKQLKRESVQLENKVSRLCEDKSSEIVSAS